MKAIEFISKLGSLAYDESKLRESGYDEEYSKESNKAFYPEKTYKTSSSDNIIIQLIEEYVCDCFNLISVISLNEKVGETNRFILVGRVWEDLLAIDKSNGEIVMLAYWDYDLITFHCALNSEKFLQAFLIHGVMPLDKDFDSEEDQWAYNISMAKKASEIAGGEKYLRFWMALYPTDNGISDEPNKYGFLN